MRSIVEVVIASKNEKKVQEIKQIIKDIPGRLLPLNSFKDLPEIIEDGPTYEENAKKKALTIANVSGRISLSDDSGLEVEALNGAPGIESSGFAKTDKDKIDKLLRLMKDIPKEKRQAKFICVVAIALPRNGKVTVLSSECKGRIGFEPKGSNGFGYDPIFIPEGFNKTFAELSQKTKNRISHRARAFKKAREILLDYIRT